MIKRKDNLLPYGLLYTFDDRYNELANEFKEHFKKLGFREINLPTLEYLSTFFEGVKSSSYLNSIKFQDMQGEILALRYDFTPMIIRIMAGNNGYADSRIKVFYHGQVYRLSHKEGGKIREIPQMGVEIIGIEGIEGDILCIESAISFLERIGIKEIELVIGDSRFVNNVINRLPTSVQEDFANAVMKKDSIEIEHIAKVSGLDNNITNIFSNYLYRLFLPAELEDISDSYIELNKDAFISIKHIAKEIAKSSNIKVKIDLTMMHKMKYYNGLIFEFIANGKRVVSGGRYDRLFERFGSKGYATGFAVYPHLLI